MSQKQALYDHLMTGATIEPIGALNHFGCFCLSQRLGELRRMHGIPIQRKMIDTPNSKKQHACYWLDKSYIDAVNAGKIKGYGK